MEQETRLDYLYEKMIEQNMDFNELHEISGISLITLKGINTRKPSPNTLIKLGIALKDKNLAKNMRRLPGDELKK